MNLTREVNIMQIAIYSNDFAITEGIREHINRKLRFALARVRSHIKSVSVRLGDINGPRGGKDKRCLLTVSISNTQELVIYDVQVDMYHAIDNALSRLSRVVVRKIDRLQKRKRQAMKMIRSRQPQEDHAELNHNDIEPYYYDRLQGEEPSLKYEDYEQGSEAIDQIVDKQTKK